jgi:hypothetical protein
VYWLKDCSSMDWYLFEVHQRYNRYISNARCWLCKKIANTGWVGIGLNLLL